MGLFNWKKKKKPVVAPEKDLSASDLLADGNELAASSLVPEDVSLEADGFPSPQEARDLMDMEQNMVDMSAPALSAENKMRLEEFIDSTSDLFRDDSKDERDAGNSFLHLLVDQGRHASPYLTDKAFAEEYFEYAERWRAFFQNKENRELFRDHDVVNLAIAHFKLKDQTWSLKHEMIQISEEVRFLKDKLQEIRSSSDPSARYVMERARNKKIRYEQCEKVYAKAVYSLKTTELALKAKGVDLGAEMDQPVSENEEKTEADISAAPDVSDIPFNF